MEETKYYVFLFILLQININITTTKFFFFKTKIDPVRIDNIISGSILTFLCQLWHIFHGRVKFMQGMKKKIIRKKYFLSFVIQKCAVATTDNKHISTKTRGRP